MIPNKFFDFDPPTRPRNRVPLLGVCGGVWVGGGERVQNFFAYYGSCVLIQTSVLNNFFLAHGPPH